MKYLTQLAAALGLVAVGHVAAIPAAQSSPAPFMRVQAQPNNFVVTKKNTINSTSEYDANKAQASSPSAPLQISFDNNYNGPASQSGNNNLYAYVVGLDSNGAAYFLQQNGQAYYPPNPAGGQPPTPITADVAIPLNGKGQSITVPLSTYMSSGRIYTSVGPMTFAVNNGPNGAVVVAPSFENPSDPNIDINWGFTEFTWNESEIYSNLSYVDFVGLVNSQTLVGSQGTCNVKGLPGNAVSTVCNGLATEGSQDGQAWAQSCQSDGNGNVLRVLAPLHLVEVDSGALSGYYDNYINQVWDHYTSNQLTITGDSLGNYNGQVDGSGNMVFNGVSFAKPVLADILGCNSGPFANPGGGSDPTTVLKQVVVPRLCAAFYRSTLLLSGGNQQPDGVAESAFYPSDTPTMWYAKLLHQVEIDRGYAFSYDDVTPQGAPDQSGACVDPNPQSLTLTVGGQQSS